MNNVRGFSLIELMISLVLGTIITIAIIQVMVSSRITNGLNQSVAQVQESGRYIMTRLSRDLLEAGRYDRVGTVMDTSVDTSVEAAFVQNHPIGLAGDFILSPALGSEEGASGASDKLVINKQDNVDCTGSTHGYTDSRHFHVVNVYEIKQSKLVCRGYDGRLLRGVKSGTLTGTTVTLMDNVESFQVQYGISTSATTSNGLPVRYVTADALASTRAALQQTVTLRIGVLLKSDSNEISQIPVSDIAVLNEAPVTTDENHYYQVFTQTMALRNMKNFVRSAK
ncbi:PilW family protein [Salinimonas chungwhensis]|uniref:PilW family protein n=1 Tax=Salinimonas chungwhensis TaxID=265425 RepID=UPI0003767DAF|nr:PilW family protein [Salinimonas chungwhensis]